MISLPLLKRNKPVIRARPEHTISRSNIDPDALKVLYRLSNAGYTAYLVGGSVRDLLLGRQPKDFDVGTNAKPGEIRRLFKNCFLIGRRFRLAHIVFGRKVIETSTFRQQPEANGSEPLQTEDNTFGTPAEDARRRDFTINGLFYDIKTFNIIDYVGGLKDLEKKILRSIGDPDIRFQEDPVRMMRAVRFAARLNFKISRGCEKSILKYHADILKASTPRVCEELFRLFTYHSSAPAFHLLWKYRLMQDLLPELDNYINTSGKNNSPLWKMLAAVDNSPMNSQLTNGTRLAALFYPMFEAELKKRHLAAPMAKLNRLQVAQEILQPAAQRLHIPRSSIYTARSILDLLPRFNTPPRGNRANRFVRHEIFPQTLALQIIALEAGFPGGDTLTEWQLFAAETGAIPNTPDGNHHPNNTNDSGAAPRELRRPRKKRRRRTPDTPRVRSSQRR